MSEPAPTFAGWYPEANTGGTRYWDGSRWTGDTRPPRKPFAAAGGDRSAAVALLGFGAFFVFMSLFAKQLNDGSVPTVGLFFGLFGVGLAGAIPGVYLFRGQGPTTQKVEERLAAELKAARGKRRGANLARFAENLTRVVQPQAPAASTSSDSAAAAQINALANPQTAKALHSLQNLLYTRTITDAEYRAAKDKLIGNQLLPDSFAQILKLAELHEAGILGDMEFSAAKAKALGL